ncbi:MAG: FG-GAP-like repeat-containing protein [Cyclobacteriaceae bacterium]
MMRLNIFPVVIFICLVRAGVSVYGQAPVINSISREVTYAGDNIIITGAGFNTDKTKMKVWFGSVAGTVLSSTAFSMEVNVPPGARVSNLEIINTASGLSVISNNRFAPYFSGSGFDAAAFNAPPYSSTGDYRTFSSAPEHYDVCACDFDLDGKPDLAASKYNSDPRIRILKNTSSVGNLSFSEQNFSSGTQVTDRIICGDLNGDGKPEIVASPSGNVNKNILTILPNNSGSGSVSFAAAQQIILPSTKAYVRSISIRDLNNDGKPELIVANSYKPSATAVAPDNVSPFYIYVNQSSGGVISFSNTPIEVSLPRYVGTYSIEIQDFDGSGLPDIAIAEFQSNSIYLLPNTSTGSISFGAVVTRQINNAAINKLTSADFNGDGKPDLAVTDFFNGDVDVFINNSTGGNISFSNPVVTRILGGPDGMDVADIDGDKDVDIVVACRTDKRVTVLINDGASSPLFSRVDIATERNIRNLYTGDLDGDAKPDLALVTFNATSNLFSIDVLRNKSCFVPAITNEQPLTNCPGQPVALSSVPGYGVTYEWKKDGVAVSSTDLPQTTVTQQGSYTVTASGECSEAQATSFPIDLTTTTGTVPATPVIQGEGSVCEGGAIELSTTPVANATYLWTGPNGFTSDQSSFSRGNATGPMAGQYSLQIVQGFCKSDVVTNVVEVINLSSFKISTESSTNSFCQGSSLQLSVSQFDGYMYQWKKNGSNITGAIGSSFIAQEEGSYTVNISSSLVPTCKTDLSPAVTVKALSPPVASFTPPVPVCTGGENLFVNTSEVDAGATPVYNWNFGSGGTFTGQNPPKVSFSTAQSALNISLTVAYEGVSGCQNSKSSSVIIEQTTVPLISPETPAVCQESPQTLSVAGGFSAIDWSTGATGPEINVNTSGAVSVLTTDVKGCKGAATVNVIALPIPEISIQASKKIISAGEQVLLTASGADTWQWEPAEFLDNPSISAPVARPTVTTKFFATGFLTDGCSARDSVEVQVDGNILFPNIFSPNGDGVNDLWEIPSFEAYSDCFLAIFDRSGRRVFEQKGYSNDWDGRYNGKLLPEGVYYFVMGCPDRVPITGNILLAR